MRLPISFFFIYLFIFSVLVMKKRVDNCAGKVVRWMNKSLRKFKLYKLHFGTLCLVLYGNGGSMWAISFISVAFVFGCYNSLVFFIKKKKKSSNS